MSLGTRLSRLPRWLVRCLVPRIRYLNLMRALEWRGLAPHVRQVKGWQVLDVGCGHGLYSLELACRGAVLHGCDLQEAGLAVARQVSNKLGLDERASFVQADATALPWPDGLFNLVVCNCVLEHIADDQAALSSMARVLRPGGLLYLTVDSAEHGRALACLERLPRQARARLLKAPIAAAQDLSSGLDALLDSQYAVRRRYRRDELELRLTGLGLTILESRAYLTGVGAAQFELLHAWKGLDPERGIGRWLYVATSVLLYPWAAWSDAQQRGRGRGLALVARRGGEAGWLGRRPSPIPEETGRCDRPQQGQGG
ncbi:MAG TPA: class I SAM-dependent methyltransferase [Anaerolineae bacterium]|nr:class I SAM-dependent methyltransferase [Anaerolineae bacterium]